MPRSRFHIGIVAAFAALYVIWGSTYLAVAEALRTMPPFLLMGTRSIAGGVILLACARLAGGRMATLKSWIHATIYGALFFVGCHGVLAYAQQRAPSGLSEVLLATIPFWIALLKAVLPGDERPRTGDAGPAAARPGGCRPDRLAADRRGCSRHICRRYPAAARRSRVLGRRHRPVRARHRTGFAGRAVRHGAGRWRPDAADAEPWPG